MLALAATAVCLVALVGLLFAERADSHAGRLATKPLASAAFVVVALARGAPGGPGGFATCVLAGLVLGAGGDVALIFKGQAAFLAGLGLFLCGHAAYVVAAAHVAPLADWVAPIALAPVAAAAIVLRWLWPRLGSMKGPVVAYVVTIVAMVIGALAVARTGALPVHAARHFVAGAVLFFASDVSVARDRFVAPGFSNRAWGLPAYYLGQLLIAWSL